MTPIRHMLLWSILIVLFLIGCEGPVGPQGERGPQGEPGPAGLTGTINIVSIDVSPTNMDMAHVGNMGIGNVEIPISEITSDVVENGLVAVYRLYGNGDVRALPYTTWADGTDGEAYTQQHQYAYREGVLHYTIQWQPWEHNPGAGTLRVVIAAP